MPIRISAPARKCQAALTALVLALFFVGASFSWPLFAHRSGGFTPPLLAQTFQRTLPARVTPTHYNITVAFDPEKHSLRATAAVTLRLDEPATAIEFELNRHLTLRTVTDPQGRSLDFVRSGRLTSHKLLVQLAEPAPAASTLVLTFAYDGSLPPAPLDYITPDGILLRDESRWYPATDLAAFATHTLAAELPENWHCIAAGRRDYHAPARGCTWVATTAAPSRALVGSRTDKTVSNPDRGGPIVSGVGLLVALHIDIKHHREFNSVVQSITDAQAYLARLLGVHAAPNEPAGPSQSRTLEVLQGFPGQSGIVGYSGPLFLVVSEDVVKWHGHPGFAPEFLPHEIAHQWFPIEVTLRSEEDGWLAESLAEYLAWRYLEARQPDDARRMVERAMRSTLARQPLRPLRLGLKLFALEDWDVTHATLYQRGMLVWRTLETVIDRERLDRALREYYARHRGGPASIADFRRICEEISGRDLAWFFDYYINGAELPTLTLRRLPSATPNELAGEIHVANAPPDFQVRVELRISTAGGNIDHSVATRGPVTPFALNLPAPVTAIELDPRLRILRVTEPARRHRAQLAALAQSSLTEKPGSDEDSLRALIRLYQSAIALDPENLAANHQLYYLHLGRLQFRLKQFGAASESLDRALALASLDPMATDLHRAWARVYRARVAIARGDRAAARREIQAGLALRSPALETPVAWPDAPAAPATAALRALAP